MSDLNDDNSLVSRTIREDISALQPYHVPVSTGMIKLDAMENPYSLPAWLKTEITNLLAQVPLNRYPDASGAKLKDCLRQVMKVPEEMDILLGNGSDELIQMIVMAIARPKAVIMSVEPSFVMYRMIATLANVQYVGIRLNEDFSINTELMLSQIKLHKPKVVFLAYPNNPTGNLFKEQDIIQIIEAAPGLVVVDEAYHVFAKASFMDKLANYPNLLVMRTISKLGLAGVRLGFLVGKKDWLQHLDKVRLPYNINSMTQIVAQAVLEHQKVLLEQAEAVIAQRRLMIAFLTRTKGLKVYPSDANFILFRVDNADEVFNRLKGHKILIKNLHGSHSLLDNCLRVTIGTTEENQQFLSALRNSL
jgi:histidinol-phosphate aminotransferase